MAKETTGAPSPLLFPTAPCALAVRPLSRETPLSSPQRRAARLHTTAPALIAEFFAFRNRRPLSSFPRGGEVYSNAEARARFAALAQVPAAHLERALPAWTQFEPAGRYDAVPALTFYSATSIATTATACTRYTATRTGRTEIARLYTTDHQHVCRRHAVWLTDPHDADQDGGELSVAGLPEVTAAQPPHHLAAPPSRHRRRLPTRPGHHRDLVGRRLAPGTRPSTATPARQAKPSGAAGLSGSS